MKIGIIVDGDAESQALFNLIKNIKINDVDILKPIYTDIQPKASYDQIVTKAIDRINFLRAKQAKKILILIDREDNQECAVKIKNALEKAFYASNCKEICIVVKDRKFENWLVADFEALRQMPKRFILTKTFQKHVQAKADTVNDAEKLLNTILAPRTAEYHKRKDAQHITAKQHPLRVACNSRSFRRFLFLLGHPNYIAQSKKPHKDCLK